MTARKPTPILLRQLASRQEHIVHALDCLETAIAAVRKARPQNAALAERLEALHAQLQQHAAAEDENP